ncbi:hypothetical protein MSG28_003026 [Choristoneura fumiferana]|uniref:Uncharacterized protein n=1 Tax=Choristoneura fumiferana TaxID=7141 RepID=A0ACC0JL43_CHOFU|nr:hypothetical protein MSG28_003026 [Choristoneura fumiferana]
MINEHVESDKFKNEIVIHFLNALTSIGRRLAGVQDKERRNGRLRAELASLDLNLPARVWLPLHQRPHHVLRIPSQAAAVLNSKDKERAMLGVSFVIESGLRKFAEDKVIDIARGTCKTDNRWGRKNFEWRPRTGRRNVGRPSTRWTD